jgi:hypothetical protein
LEAERINSSHFYTALSLQITPIYWHKFQLGINGDARIFLLLPYVACQAEWQICQDNRLCG